MAHVWRELAHIERFVGMLTSRSLKAPTEKIKINFVVRRDSIPHLIQHFYLEMEVEFREVKRLAHVHIARGQVN